MTIDLEMIGKDKNFDTEADNNEKAERVIALIDAVENLSLIVKGNMDNAEPLFVVGGLSERKTHYFENVVHVKSNKLQISDDLKEKIKKGYRVGLLKGLAFDNEAEIVAQLNPISVSEFFDKLKEDVKAYYGC
jgi:CRISPR-associated protein Cst2